MAYVPRPSFDDETSALVNSQGGVFIHDDSHPRASIVHVFGEATFADVEVFESMIVGVVRIGRPVILDMRECSYMDCAAIGVIVRAAKNLGDQLRLIVPRKSQNYRLLELTGLTRVLHLAESTEAAAAPVAPSADDAPPQRRLRLVR
jgi:anti-anti-sigma factor